MPRYTITIITDNKYLSADIFVKKYCQENFTQQFAIANDSEGHEFCFYRSSALLTSDLPKMTAKDTEDFVQGQLFSDTDQVILIGEGGWQRLMLEALKRNNIRTMWMVGDHSPIYAFDCVTTGSKMPMNERLKRLCGIVENTEYSVVEPPKQPKDVTNIARCIVDLIYSEPCVQEPAPVSESSGSETAGEKTLPVVDTHYHIKREDIDELKQLYRKYNIASKAMWGATNISLDQDISRDVEKIGSEFEINSNAVNHEFMGLTAKATEKYREGIIRKLGEMLVSYELNC